MIRFCRFMQWFCVVFCAVDFGVGVLWSVRGRWGYMIFELAAAAFMAAMWRANGKLAEREESKRLERELWYG